MSSFPNGCVIQIKGNRIEIIENYGFGSVEEKFVFYLILFLLPHKMLQQLRVHEERFRQVFFMFNVTIDFEELMLDVSLTMRNSSSHLFILL